MSDIHLFKMRSGEEVLAQVEEANEYGWEVVHPRRIIMTEKYGNSGTYSTEPYIVCMKGIDLFIDADDILYHIFPEDIKDEFIMMYNHGIGIYNDPLA